MTLLPLLFSKSFCPLGYILKGQLSAVAPYNTVVLGIDNVISTEVIEMDITDSRLVQCIASGLKCTTQLLF